MRPSTSPRLSPSAFERLVAEALDGLPKGIVRYLDNVQVTVEDLAAPAQLRELGMDDPYELLGLYEGTPLTARGADYGIVLPDRITIYRLPLLAICDSDEALREEVRHTVVHELAHHFGIDDDRLEELGAY